MWKVLPLPHDTYVDENDDMEGIQPNVLHRSALKTTSQRWCGSEEYNFIPTWHGVKRVRLDGL
jgi:hypothetical protein